MQAQHRIGGLGLKLVFQCRVQGKWIDGGFWGEQTCEYENRESFAVYKSKYITYGAINK